MQEDGETACVGRRACVERRWLHHPVVQERINRKQERKIERKETSKRTTLRKNYKNFSKQGSKKPPKTWHSERTTFLSVFSEAFLFFGAVFFRDYSGGFDMWSKCGEGVTKCYALEERA